MNTGDTSDDSVMLAKIARLEKRLQEAEKATSEPGGWKRYHALNTELHELKQKYFRSRKARRRAAEKKKPNHPEIKPASAATASETTGVSPSKGDDRSESGIRGENMDRPQEANESGISDHDVAKKVAQKKTSIQCHAKPCEKKKLTEPEHTVFSGDAPCPKCQTVIWVEWQNTTVKMACSKCGFRFDHQEAIAFLSAYEPEDNFKAAQAAQSLELSDVLERAKAVLAKHEAADAGTPSPGTAPRRAYPPGYTPNPVVEAMTGAQQAGKKRGGEAGPDDRNAPLYCDCANCGKTLDITGVASDEQVDCPHCRTSHVTRAGVLNLRNTTQRVDPRGWFGRLFLGSALQKSAAERRAEDRAVLVRNIEIYRHSVEIAERQRDFQRATFYQRELENAEQQLEDFDE